MIFLPLGLIGWVFSCHILVCNHALVLSGVRNPAHLFSLWRCIQLQWKHFGFKEPGEKLQQILFEICVTWQYDQFDSWSEI